MCLKPAGRPRASASWHASLLVVYGDKFVRSLLAGTSSVAACESCEMVLVQDRKQEAVLKACVALGTGRGYGGRRCSGRGCGSRLAGVLLLPDPGGEAVLACAGRGAPLLHLEASLSSSAL